MMLNGRTLDMAWSAVGSADVEARNNKRRRLNDHTHIPPREEGQQPQCTSTLYSFPVQDLLGQPDYPDYFSPQDEDGSLKSCNELGNSYQAQAEDSQLEDFTTLSEQCCYGMLPGIPVKLAAGYLESSSYLPVVFESPDTCRLQDNNKTHTFHIENPIHATILNQLSAIEGGGTQLYCSTGYAAPSSRRQRLSGKQGGILRQLWTLNIILYGPADLEGAMGRFLSQHKMYLQDPLHCDRNLPYRNPHIIPLETGEILMTDSLERPMGNLKIERLEAGPDLLSQLMSDELPLPETDAPDIVKTALFSHQKQALTFMLRREEGWQMGGSGDIWTAETDCFGRMRYRNNVSKNYQVDPPPRFQGGLLADEMGLGKTLSMICLIAGNQLSKYLPTPPISPQPIECNTVKTTLLIVPPALIQSWQKQFQLHLEHSALRIHVFHGQNRKDVDFLAGFDVVITTFHTVSSIWRQCKDNQNGSKSIFSILWYRVVLDEAHIVQNPPPKS